MIAIRRPSASPGATSIEETPPKADHATPFPSRSVHAARPHTNNRRPLRRHIASSSVRQTHDLSSQNSRSSRSAAQAPARAQPPSKRPHPKPATPPRSRAAAFTLRGPTPTTPTPCAASPHRSRPTARRADPSAPGLPGQPKRQRGPNLHRRNHPKPTTPPRSRAAAFTLRGPTPTTAAPCAAISHQVPYVRPTTCHHKSGDDRDPTPKRQPGRNLHRRDPTQSRPRHPVPEPQRSRCAAPHQQPPPPAPPYRIKFRTSGPQPVITKVAMIAIRRPSASPGATSIEETPPKVDHATPFPSRSVHAARPHTNDRRPLRRHIASSSVRQTHDLSSQNSRSSRSAAQAPARAQPPSKRPHPKSTTPPRSRAAAFTLRGPTPTTAAPCAAISHQAPYVRPTTCHHRTRDHRDPTPKATVRQTPRTKPIVEPSAQAPRRSRSTHPRRSYRSRNTAPGAVPTLSGRNPGTPAAMNLQTAGGSDRELPRRAHRSTTESPRPNSPRYPIRAGGGATWGKSRT